MPEAGASDPGSPGGAAAPVGTRRRFFSMGSLSASAALLTVVLLMLGAPFLVLTFFVCVTYAVVPVSLWQKHRSRVLRGIIVAVCVLGYGVVAVGIAIDLYLSWMEPATGAAPGFIAFPASLVAGVLFLPLAAAGSLHTLRKRLREHRESLGGGPG